MLLRKLYKSAFYKISNKILYNKSQKQDDNKQLKTYLEIIPPHEIYDLIQKKQKNTFNLIKKLRNQKITPALQKQCEKQLLKNVKYFKPHEVNDLIEISSTKSSKIINLIYKKIITNLTVKAEAINIYDLINMVYTLAKYNKKEPELMKELQNRIIEQKLKINYTVMKKILFSFTHLNLGSATLYSEITRVIKIGQHEFDPINLAEFAYYLSKVQENAKGGFGIFKIAEQHLQQILKIQSFSQLVNISHYMIIQNLGSNKFQLALEEYIYNKFPVQNVNINHLCKLIKSMSGYIFKFKDGALQQKLENETVSNLKYMTLQQSNDILWSWGRCSRGNLQLWQELQKYYQKKINLLKPRQLSFCYYSFCRSPFAHSLAIIQKFQKIFMSLNSEQINLHYYIKVLLGMHKRRVYNTQLFLNLISVVIKKMNKLTNTQFINFLVVINESDLHFESENIEKLKELLVNSQERLLSLLNYYKISEISEILFLWIKFNMSNEKFTNELMEHLIEIKQIPKKSFIKAMFSFIIKDKPHLFLPMLPILYELRNYGPIAYFFPPHELPFLVYSVFHIAVNGRTTSQKPIQVPRWLLDELKQYFYELEIRSLNQFALKVYKESENLIKKFYDL